MVIYLIILKKKKKKTKKKALLDPPNENRSTWSWFWSWSLHLVPDGERCRRTEEEESHRVTWRQRRRRGTERIRTKKVAKIFKVKPDDQLDPNQTFGS